MRIRCIIWVASLFLKAIAEAQEDEKNCRADPISARCDTKNKNHVYYDASSETYMVTNCECSVGANSFFKVADCNAACDTARANE